MKRMAQLGKPRPACSDERGATLQSLIITAVLVLMATLVGVVTIAITRSASGGLANQAPSMAGHGCNNVETYDLEYAALEQPGANRGHQGSAVGCVPVCVLDFRGKSVTGDDLDDVAHAARDLPVHAPPEVRQYEYDSRNREARTPARDLWDNRRNGVEIVQYGNVIGNRGEGVRVAGPLQPDELSGRVFLMQDSGHVFATGDGVAQGLALSEDIADIFKVEEFAVRTTKAGKECEVYDAAGEPAGNSDPARDS